MIFCYGVFWKSGHPRFYSSVVEKMRGADSKAFLTRDDFDQFTRSLTQLLNEAKPKSHKANIHVHFSGQDKGCIYLESGKLDDDICRLHFCGFNEIIAYDKKTRRFFDATPKMAAGLFLLEKRNKYENKSNNRR